jgi:uncharacterized membrane protein YdjX (TVP38/TMEM64 family)
MFASTITVSVRRCAWTIVIGLFPGRVILTIACFNGGTRR